MHAERQDTAKLKSLFGKQKKLGEKYPELSQSFEEFLQSYSKYRNEVQLANGSNKLQDYLLYGARYEPVE